MNVTIRRIRAEDAALARALRLRALASDRLSFGSTYEAEVGRDDAFWDESTKRHAESEDQAIFLAMSGDAAVGVVRGARDETRPGFFLIHSMWVAPELRRQGVAAALLDTVEKWIASGGGAVCELAVTNAAPAARRLYERAGYLADGHTEPGRHSGLIEHRMRKTL